MRSNLTIRFSFQQLAYSIISAGIMSFATAFLLLKGFSASVIGVLLASGNLLSCGFQPFLAAWADRKSGNIVKYMIIFLTICSILCFSSILFFSPPHHVFGLLYLFGVFAFDAIMPLGNALCVRYNANDYGINYGIGRGVGAIAYSIAALVIGNIMTHLGEDWMLILSIAFMFILSLIVLGYPNIQTDTISEKYSDTSTILEFIRTYKWYCISLLGILLLAMFHIMVENYLIEIVMPLGGDSTSVGNALFLATLAEIPVFLLFDKIKEKIKDTTLLKIAGIFYVIKSVLFLIASSVILIYIAQILQAVTYCFLSATQLYYANNRIHRRDMVKGQAFITAAYSLGCALGNFTGGQLCHYFSVKSLLIWGVMISSLGTILLFLTLDKEDNI